MTNSLEGLFVSTASPKTIARLRRALRRNQRMDQLDGGLRHLPVHVQLRTAIAAILCGLDTRHLNPVLEGLVLVMQAERLLREGR